MKRGIGIRGQKNILRFWQWLMWGVGIQRNLFNEKIDIKIQLFGNSEQLKDIKSIQSRIGRIGQSFEIIQSGYWTSLKGI